MKRKEKLVHRLFPISAYDIPAVESWLAAMAAKGLFFVRLGGFTAHLRRGAPCAARYRLEPSPGSRRPAEEVLYCADCGWHYVASLSGLFSIYMTTDPAAPELHTDPVAQSYTLDAMNRRMRRSAVTLAALLLLLFAFLFIPLYFTSTRPVLRLVGDSFSILASPVLILIMVSAFFRDFLHVGRTRNALRAGIPLNHKKDYRKAVRAGVLFNAAMLTLAASFLIYSIVLLGISRTLRRDIPLSASAVPYVALADLEHDSQLTPLTDMRGGVDRRNCAHRDWSPLAPVQYTTEQHGEVPGRIWPDGSGTYSPSLNLDYYALSLPFLSGPLLEDLMEYHLYDPGAYDVHELDAPGFDRAVLAVDRRDGSPQLLFARRGGKVLCVRYYGLVDLTQALDRFAALLA